MQKPDSPDWCVQIASQTIDSESERISGHIEFAEPPGLEQSFEDLEDWKKATLDHWNALTKVSLSQYPGASINWDLGSGQLRVRLEKQRDHDLQDWFYKFEKTIGLDPHKAASRRQIPQEGEERRFFAPQNADEEWFKK